MQTNPVFQIDLREELLGELVHLIRELDRGNVPHVSTDIHHVYVHFWTGAPTDDGVDIGHLPVSAALDALFNDVYLWRECGPDVEEGKDKDDLNLKDAVTLELRTHQENPMKTADLYDDGYCVRVRFDGDQRRWPNDGADHQGFPHLCKWPEGSAWRAAARWARQQGAERVSLDLGDPGGARWCECCGNGLGTIHNAGASISCPECNPQLVEEPTDATA